MTCTPDFKPPGRIRASQSEWLVLRARKLDVCRICDVRTWVTLHHLVGKDLGGDDVEDNLVSLCGDGVFGCHGRVQRLERESCAALRAKLTPAEVGYVIGKKNRVFLDRYLPVAA